MKWGVRRSPEELGHYSDKKVDKIARKDAKRFADAKMYYGEGAGTRRKLLNAELEKKKKDARYAKAFEQYLSNQDYAKSANKAKFERGARDTGKAAVRIGKKAAGAAALVGGIYYAYNKPKVDAFILKQLNKVTRGRF